MRYGIQGFLGEEHYRYERENPLRYGFGAAKENTFIISWIHGRYKSPDICDDRDLYNRIFEILNEYGITAFFYIGGNDSMDTIKKLSDYAILMNSPIRFIGVPKTIDNDLAVTDHTPGFGSAAKYIASATKELIRDGLVYDVKNVTIIEIMGRKPAGLQVPQLLPTARTVRELTFSTSLSFLLMSIYS